MIRSMTAYARAKSQLVEGLFWSIELVSVNRKTLDIQMHIGRELLFLDLEIRKEITQVIHRGQFTVKITLVKGKQTVHSLPLLTKLKQQFTELAKKLKLPTDEITLSFLLEQLERISLEEELGPKIQTAIKKTLKKALEELIEMKQTEGKALAVDLKKRIKTLLTLVQEIKKETKKSPDKYREKILGRLQEILGESEVDERILREVALFAEKIDITEEIIRLQSHLKQTESLLLSKQSSVGRTLEFLTQEMLREINTIASKSASIAVTKKTIEAKAELEKIREQVQNIE